ncbi:polysaccharide export protein [Flavihumibacter sp. R14]|nr:polysaccharide export protein [Flavihumibacter soli]
MCITFKNALHKAPFVVLSVTVILHSCVSYKHTPYFKDLPQAAVLNQDIDNHSPVVIQPNDVLNITVKSLSKEAEQFAPSPTRITIGTEEDETRDGYLVNPNGEIYLPLIGNLKVSGLTTIEVNDLITKQLKNHLKDPVVNVRLVNFKVSVFGDVGKPGIYTVTNERITVLEAIILAGDLNKEAVRTNILLIREINKQRQFIRLDIESQSIFKSPYFYLKNNDLIYVETKKSHDTRRALIDNILTASAVVTFVLLLFRF